jgi:hypothetical protein
MPSKQQNGGDERRQITQEEQARFTKAAKQVIAYANFLRWSANFLRDEVVKHPCHDQVMLLSPMQSGRFSFAIDGDTLLLGVQSFEAAWMAAMPFDCAYVSDRLYLSVEGVTCMDSNLPPLALGIFVDDPVKLSAMAAAKFVQPTHVQVVNGKIAQVGRAFGLGFVISQGDVINQLVLAKKKNLHKNDMSRFF